MRHVFDDMREEDEDLIDTSGNLPPMAGFFPDYPASIIRHGPQGWQLTMARWGMQTPQVFLDGKPTDPGETKIRNAVSPHWKRWLGAHGGASPTDDGAGIRSDGQHPRPPPGLQTFGNNPRLYRSRPVPLAHSREAQQPRAVPCSRHLHSPSDAKPLVAGSPNVRNTSIQWGGNAAYAVDNPAASSLRD